MEARLVNEQGGNEKMAFLLPTSPYFAYYKQRLVEEKAELSGEKIVNGEETKEPEEPEKEKIEEPAKLEWLLGVDTATVPPLEFELIRLVAQYVAKNGRSFQMGLWNRESRNPQFGFLNDRHPLNDLYQTFVDCYSRIIVADESVRKPHRPENRTKAKILEDIMKRKAWKKSQLKSEEEAKADEDAERSATHAIDWNDAIIVESIVFDPADDPYLPAPIEQSKLLTVYLATKQREEDERQKRSDEQQQQQQQQSQQQQQQSQQQQRSGGGQAGIPVISDPTSSITQAEPKTAVELQRGAKKLTSICPICRMTFPNDEIEAHMKVEMTRGGNVGIHNPARNRPAQPEFAPVVASGEDMADHLAKMARRRLDLFGDDDDEKSIMEAKRSERDRKEREAQAAAAAVSYGYRPEQYDSHTSTDKSSQPSMAPNRFSVPQTAASRGMAPTPTSDFIPGKRSAPDIPEEVPVAKKPKANEVIDLLPEKEWAEQHPENITLKVSSEGDSGTETFDLEMPIMSSVKVLKDELAKKTNLAPNKQILKIEQLGFLKDKLTLAHYNVVSGTSLQLSTKERGGRKK
jgi:splicing factor 3A subunit 1